MAPGARKPKRPRPNPAIVALLEEWLRIAREGGVQGVFLLGVQPCGRWSACFEVPDVDDLLVELRTVSIQVDDDLAAPVH